MHDVRAVLLAGGLGRRMGRLTENRIKPMLPFAGRCHLVDFSLANAERSGVEEVVLLSHHGEEQLIRYLKTTWPRPDFRIHFGPHEEPPRTAGELRQARRRPELGTADALLANAEYVFDERFRDVLVLHADHVYRFDYWPMVDHHRSSGAALTIGYQAISPAYVSLFGMVELDGSGWLTRLVEKPSEPTSNLVFAAFCVFDRAALEEYLLQLEGTQWHGDISRDLIPAMLAAGERIATYQVRDYWADIGTEERYHREHLAMLGADPPLRLADAPSTLRPELARSYVGEGPGLRDVLVPTDLVNDGEIVHSVIYPGVRVGAGASVRDSVVLPGAIIGAGARVHGRTVLEGEAVPAATARK